MSKLKALLESSLFLEASSPDLFNPYSSLDSDLDRIDAVDIRRTNLLNYCSRSRKKNPVLLLAEAPGPWGCRFSGVPITSEAQLLDPGFPLEGRQSSAAAEPHREYSAGIYWRVLGPWIDHIFTWNTVPLHPHRPENPLSIRTPRTREIRRFQPLLRSIVDILHPQSVLAVGRKAERSLQELNIDCHYIRHPSQGGSAEFEQGIHEAMARLGLLVDKD